MGYFNSAMVLANQPDWSALDSFPSDHGLRAYSHKDGGPWLLECWRLSRRGDPYPFQGAPSDNFLALATRSYAAFLFPQRRSEEGREQFRRSIALLKGGDNLVRLTNGVTYQMWGHHDKSGTSWFSLWLRRQRFGFTCH